MSLFEEMSRLSQQCIQAYDGRVAAIADIHKDVLQELKELHTMRQAMSEQQRQSLQEYIAALRYHTEDHLAELHKARETMSEQQRQHLSAQLEELRHRVATFRSEIRTDQDKAHETWRHFTETMQQRRANKSSF